MKKLFILFISAMLILSLFSGCEAAKPQQTEPQQTEPALTYAGKTVAFVGDSITYGIGLENLTNQYWLHLRNSMGFKLARNCGVSGSCVSTQSDRGFERSPLALRVNSIPQSNLIFIFMGTNDFGHNVAIGTIEDQQDESFMGAWNFVLNTIKTGYPNARVILMTSLPHKLHPNEAGHELMAERIQTWLEENIETVLG